MEKHIETKDKLSDYEKMVFGEVAVEFQYSSDYTPIIGRLDNGTILFYNRSRHEIIAMEDEGKNLVKRDFNTESSYFNIKKVANDKSIEDYIINISDQIDLLHPRYNWLIEPTTIQNITSKLKELLGECEHRIHTPDDFEDQRCKKCGKEVEKQKVTKSKEFVELVV